MYYANILAEPGQSRTLNVFQASKLAPICLTVSLQASMTTVCRFSITAQRHLQLPRA